MQVVPAITGARGCLTHPLALPFQPCDAAPPVAVVVAVVPAHAQPLAVLVAVVPAHFADDVLAEDNCLILLATNAAVASTTRHAPYFLFYSMPLGASPNHSLFPCDQLLRNCPRQDARGCLHQPLALPRPTATTKPFTKKNCMVFLQALREPLILLLLDRCYLVQVVA